MIVFSGKTVSFLTQKVFLVPHIFNESAFLLYQFLFRCSTTELLFLPFLDLRNFLIYVFKMSLLPPNLLMLCPYNGLFALHSTIEVSTSESDYSYSWYPFKLIPSSDTPHVPNPTRTRDSGPLDNLTPRFRISHQDETPVSFKISVQIDLNPFKLIILDLYRRHDPLIDDPIWTILDC